MMCMKHRYQRNPIPTKQECLVILKKYNTPQNVIEHCITVTTVAERIVNKIPSVNKSIVIAGAMLHDIGRSVTHGLRHAIEGANILKKENIDERIINIVLHHIGTGISREESLKLGLPEDNYSPKTLEEIIVSYADNIVKGNNEIGFTSAVHMLIKKFGKESKIVKNFYRQKEIIENNMKKG